MSSSPAPIVKDHLVTLQELKAGVPPEEALQQIPPDYDYWYHSELYAYQVDEKLYRHRGSDCQEACIDGNPHDAGWFCQFCRTIYSFNANQYRREVHMNHLKQCTMYNSFRKLSRLERLEARSLFIAALEKVDRSILIREEDERLGWKEVRKEQDDEQEERRSEWLAGKDDKLKRKKRKIESPSPSPSLSPPPPSSTSITTSLSCKSARRELEDAINKAASSQTVTSSPPKRFRRTSLRKPTSFGESAVQPQRDPRPTAHSTASLHSSASQTFMAAGPSTSAAQRSTTEEREEPACQSKLAGARDSLEPVSRRFSSQASMKQEVPAKPVTNAPQLQPSQLSVRARISSNGTVFLGKGKATALVPQFVDASRGNPNCTNLSKIGPVKPQSTPTPPAPSLSSSGTQRSSTYPNRSTTPARVLGSSATPFDLTLDAGSDDEKKPKVAITSAIQARKKRSSVITGLPVYLQQYEKWFQIAELDNAAELQMELEPYQATEFVETLRSRGEKEGLKMNAIVQTKFTVDLRRFLS